MTHLYAKRNATVSSDEHTTSNSEGHHYKYIKKRGDKWVIVQKGTGKVLSHHDTREKAEASFRAMMRSKHGG